MAFPDDFSLEFRDLDTDQYVYHYTRRETAFQHILPSRTIRLGPLSQTNDPRETKSWTFGLSGGSNDFPTDLAKRKLEIDRLTRSLTQPKRSERIVKFYASRWMIRLMILMTFTNSSAALVIRECGTNMARSMRVAA